MQQMLSSVSIQFLTGPEKGQTFPLNKQCTAIGREPAQNDIILTEKSISRLHAQVICLNGNVSIRNVSLNDNNLTVNQQKILSNQQRNLSDGDTVGIGQDTTFRVLIQPSSFQPVPPPAAGAVGGSGMRPPYQSPQPPQLPQSGAWQQQNNKTERAPQPGMSAVAAMPSIEVSTNTNSGKQIYQLPLNKPVVTIGRDQASDLCINEPIVSSQHFQIVRENNQFVIVHPHPARQKTINGLYYEGRHYKGEEPFRKVLAQGDVFRIGNEFGTLVTLTYNDGSGKKRDRVPALPPIMLGAPLITIGRGPDNMVVLQHPQVSARHARLLENQGTYSIVDMGSTNHVYVNGQRITNQLLKVGDEIRIGPYKLTFTGTQLTQLDESKSIRIDALGLKKLGNKQKVLINDISISIPPGKFVALVGGSGAGKSTLMDALNGLRPASSGQVFYNGQDYYNSLASFRTQLGYVPQADIVHTDLTVEKALYYAAKLRLPEDYSEQQIKHRISEVLAAVDLAPNKHTLLVSKLSGGQRKRVSIALELLAEPSVFFLDEPTSGLDPGLDRKMMLLLRNLADKGHTIVLVTHATNNIISNCDYVCFLCQDGRLAYFGPPDEAMTYFGQSDFADIYSALEPTEKKPDIPKEAENRFKQSAEYRRYVAEPLRQRPATRTTNLPATMPKGDIRLKRGNPQKQFSLLSRRYIELILNDRGTLLILLLQAPIIGAILLVIINSLLGTDTFTSMQPPPGANAEKTLFIMAFAAVLFGSSNAAREIVKEVEIYKRERAVNLGIVPYMLSKVVVLGILCLFQCAVLVFMVNWISPFQQGIDGFLPPAFSIYITMCLTAIAGLMMGLTVSAVAPNSDRATTFIPIILIPQVIFSGILFKLDGGPAQFIGGLFAARWAMVGMGSTINLCGPTLSDGSSPCPNVIGSDGFSFQHDAGHVLLSWFILIVMIVVFGCATAYFLKRKDIKVGTDLSRPRP